ncbi:MAG: zinc-dependent metalloprotease, partial [Myxococcota bacterium]
TAYIRGHVYELGASTVNDYVEFINDEQTVSDVIYGQQIRRHVANTLERRSDELRTGLSSNLADMLDQRIAGLGATRDDKLLELRNPDQLKHRMEKVKGTRLEERLVSQFDLAMAGFQTNWRPGDPVSDAQWDKAAPWGRALERNPLSSVSERARLALSESGFCFLNNDFDPHWAGLAFNLKDLDRQQRYELIANRLLAHVMLHEVGHNVGLAHNFEGSFDAMNYSGKFWNNTCVDGVDVPDCSEPSVVEQFRQRQIEEQIDELRHTTVMEYMSNKGMYADFLGKYDIAAIRFAYAEQVEVFDSPDVAVAGGDSLRQWRYLNNYRDIPNHLCGGTCGDVQTARRVLSQRSWVKFDPQNPPENEVPYLFCDNVYNRLTPFCATFDYGSSLTEVFMNYKSMWQDYFFFNNFIRDRLAPIAWSPDRATQAVPLVFNFSDVVAQYFYIMTVNAQNDPSDPFLSSYLRNDMASVLGRSLNFATEVMSTPEPERMCTWTTDPAVYLPGRFLNNCDEYAPLDSATAIASNAIQPPLGDARPSSLAFTEDYEDFSWAYVGSFFDKDNTLLLLGWTQPRLFRFNYELDRRNYFISHYRLFEQELRSFYDRILDFDGFFIRQQTAVELGSFWCQREDAPGLAYLGYFEPRRMIDLDTMELFPGPSDACREPAYLYPTILANIPFNAMFYAHALFSSDFDAQLDMGKEMKIFVRGADDDFVDWAALPNCETAEPNADCFCAMTDLLTGLEYRGLQQSSDTESIACRLISTAQDAQTSYEGSDGNPSVKDYWRGRIERLEFARDLYRLYHNR